MDVVCWVEGEEGEDEDAMTPAATDGGRHPTMDKKVWEKMWGGKRRRRKWRRPLPSGLSLPTLSPPRHTLTLSLLWDCWKKSRMTSFKITAFGEEKSSLEALIPTMGRGVGIRKNKPQKAHKWAQYTARQVSELIKPKCEENQKVRGTRVWT